MSILILLVPLALLLAGASVLAFRWATAHDQFDDLQTPALRVLLDDDGAPSSRQESQR